MRTHHKIYEEGYNEINITASGSRLTLSMEVTSGGLIMHTHHSRDLTPDDVIMMAAKMLYPVFEVTADDVEVTRKLRNAIETLGFRLIEK